MDVERIGSGVIYQGHVLEVLRTLPADTVDCVVTSPPYWGLRDYKIEPQVWDEPRKGCCRHFIDHRETFVDNGHEWGEDLPHTKGTGGHNPKQDSNAGSWQENGTTQGSFCLRCGAWRGSLGLEPTPELFVKHIVEIFREVRRVLKPTGVCFVNLGDSYWSDTLSRKDPVEAMWGNRPASDLSNGRDKIPEGNRRGGLGKRPEGLKPKDLCGIPWRVAFALQADGWWLRSDIIWSKPNPMPESVTDRPTKSHEYIFLLTKSQKYFWDQEAVRENHTRDWSKENWTHNKKYGTKESSMGQEHGGQKTIAETFNPSGRNIRSVWTAKPDLWRLRSDLSASDRSYVLGELLKRGLSENTHDNESDQNE